MNRELIINVDDIGIVGGAVEPAIETIAEGIAASGSVMAVCPGTSAALELLAERPEVPVGVHLTLTADFAGSQWRPITSGATIQHEGRFFGIEQREHLLAQADSREIRAEFRAQIERVLDAGVLPTHLDWHCLADGGREDVFDLTLELAVEYRTSIRAWTDYGRSAAQTRGFTVQDQPFLDSFSVPLTNKHAILLERIRDLPTGLTEWAVHPARPHATDHDALVRQTDHDFLMAASTRRTLHEESVDVVGYGDPKLRPHR